MFPVSIPPMRAVESSGSFLRSAIIPRLLLPGSFQHCSVSRLHLVASEAGHLPQSVLRGTRLAPPPPDGHVPRRRRAPPDPPIGPAPCSPEMHSVSSRPDARG